MAKELFVLHDAQWLNDEQREAFRSVLRLPNDDTVRVCPIRLQGPRELANILAALRRTQGERPVVLLPPQPLPAAALEEGLAEFWIFENARSVRPLRVLSMCFVAEDPVYRGAPKFVRFAPWLPKQE